VAGQLVSDDAVVPRIAAVLFMFANDLQFHIFLFACHKGTGFL